MDDLNKQIQQQFGAHAEKYATSQVHAHGASLARLIELTQPRSDWIALDVSTGAGHTALAFAPRVARVIACDLTPQMLDAARKIAKEREITNIEFRDADAHALPFDDAMFDLVTNRIALHHYSDARKAIAEMARMCKPGGIVALVDNIVPPDKIIAGALNHFEKERDPSHNWCYPLARLEAMFNDAGLQIAHSETIRKEMEFEPWVARMGASGETQAKLRAWLLGERDAAREWLTPRVDGEKLFFSLTEAIVIGRNDPKG
ncbi:MAG: methyltransferase domain-containing protein [Chloroflexi bacterium]|nr:methyltransferase domain-containing protein [Chloroflexota bacterium]